MNRLLLLLVGPFIAGCAAASNGDLISQDDLDRIDESALAERLESNSTTTVSHKRAGSGGWSASRPRTAARATRNFSSRPC